MCKKLFCLILFSIWSNYASAGYFPMYSKWEQPGGLGSPITLTYSYINLLDGGILDGTTGDSIPAPMLKSIFETALWDYANVLPIHFIEVIDSGPQPETGQYEPTGLPDIRIGYVPHVDNANAYAYFPNEASGLAGDIVFNAERFGFDWSTVLFYAVAQHELGHSLGMGHFLDEDPPTTDLLFGESNYQGPKFPLTVDMLSALQGAYGSGVGSVTAAVPLPAAFWLFSTALGLLGFRFRRD